VIALKKKSLVDCGFFSELEKHAIDSTDLPIIILRVLEQPAQKI
jgi:hypothetical protein